MKHGLHASNAHLDPLTHSDGPSSAAIVSLPGSNTISPASASMSDPLADGGKASQSTFCSSRHFLRAIHSPSGKALPLMDWGACTSACLGDSTSMSAGTQQTPSGSSPSHRARLRCFEQELAASPISMKQLRRLAFHGIPEKDGLRATTWKVHAAVSSNALLLPTKCCIGTRFILLKGERGRQGILLCQIQHHSSSWFNG